MADDRFERDRIWLNGKEENINDRILKCLQEIRKRIPPKTDQEGKIVIPSEKLMSMKLHICTENNFPTASGLASSASGYACLVFTLSQLFGITESYPGELSTIARMGSGSACRSMYGGFVKWEAGEKSTGEDSVAVQVAPQEHWPLSVLILVVSQKKKEISSTSGMETSVKNSELIKYRKEHVLPERMSRLENAIKERDFQTFGIETMKDSNQFHAICLDTYPPIFYMNDISKKIVHLITCYNNHYNQIRVAYTFDAGPNAVLYIPPENFEEVHALVEFYFPVGGKHLISSLPKALCGFMDRVEEGLERIIVTKIGTGPQVLSEEDSLLSTHTGLPK